MGFIKDMKAGTIGAEAVKAREAGQVVFTPMLNTPMSNPGMSGAINDWAVMIGAIEAAGWRLDHWAVSTDTKGRPQAYPLFRAL